MPDLIFPRSRSPVQSVHGRTGAVVSAPGDYTASQITVTPAGSIAATDAQAALNELDTEKAPLASPALTGTPTAPTASAGTNTTQLATTAFVSTAIANLIDSSPAALDTLNELAAALGDDQNFATTMTNALALKAPLASPALTGTPTAPTATPGTNTTQLATTAFVTAAVAAGGLTMEQIEDALAAGVIVSGFNVLIEYDDTANTFTFHNAERICSDADAATITFDLSDDHEDANAGAWHATEPITADRTLAITNAGIGANNAPGKRFQIQLNYDETGGHVVTWFPNVNWVNRYPPALTPVGGGSDTFEFLVTSLDEYGVPTLEGWILSTERGVMGEHTAEATGLTDLDAYWKLDEASGTRSDETGNFDLAESGGATGSTTGKVGDAAQMTAGRYLRNSNSVLTECDRDFTVWAWVNLADTSFIELVSTDSSWRLCQGRAGNNRFSFVVESSLGAVAVESNNFGASPTSAWSFVVGTFNATTKVLSVSVNAGTANTTTMTGTPASGGGAQFTVLAGHTGTLLDEVGIAPRVLSSDEISYLYNSGSGRTTPFASTFAAEIDWSTREGETLTLPPGSGTYTINHSNVIPLKELLVKITSDNASGSFDWDGVAVTWLGTGAPSVPADGDSIYLKFQAVSVSEIIGWQL